MLVVSELLPNPSICGESTGGARASVLFLDLGMLHVLTDLHGTGYLHMGDAARPDRLTRDGVLAQGDGVFAHGDAARPDRLTRDWVFAHGGMLHVLTDLHGTGSESLVRSTGMG
jgi:hypothetical protein